MRAIFYQSCHSCGSRNPARHVCGRKKASLDSRLRGNDNSVVNGFTLIELSIVLVIIGLIVGGVLVGQDLIRAAYIRAQISQIEKFNTAVNTFYGKYQALPGDMNAQVAQTNGFAARGTNPGEGDGNGIIEGYVYGRGLGFVFVPGETGMFWVDLSSVVAGGLIEGGFNMASSTVPLSSDVIVSAISQYFPTAKIGNGNYIYAYSGDIIGSGDLSPAAWIATGTNYFGLSAVYGISSADGVLHSFPGLSVQQAYNIDKKIDDGFPQSGNVTAQYLGWNSPVWAANPNAPRT